MAPPIPPEAPVTKAVWLDRSNKCKTLRGDLLTKISVEFFRGAELCRLHSS
jgi:hypothetical protein